MGAEIASVVRSEMTVNFDKVQFWTDNMATLDWVKSIKHQKVYIANRIAKILANCEWGQGNFVPGKINPADHGTRGLFLTDLKEKWLSLPKFLHENPVRHLQRDQQYRETYSKKRIRAIERRRFSLVITRVYSEKCLANGSNCEMPQWKRQTSTILWNKNINWSTKQTRSQVS